MFSYNCFYAAQLKLGDDPMLALGAAAILLLSTQAGGDPLVFAREDIAKLLARVLEASLRLFPY